MFINGIEYNTHKCVDCGELYLDWIGSCYDCVGGEIVELDTLIACD
jgi:predicted ATP-dependent serine protease